jgi:hypothetical protein
MSDRHKRWRLENPDKVRAQRERRKARLRGDAPPRKIVNKREAEKRRKAKERADRSAMIAEIMARPVVKESLTTAVCPEPPELSARSPFTGRKRSVFNLRAGY